jgi:MurNAc alpha-1-phosphate uridylyltransferase
MILAAGRGERMRPLTDSTPKPLLCVRGKPLLQWHLEALYRGGCRHALINTAWLGDHITLNFGSVFRPQPTWNKRKQLSIEEQTASELRLAYSHEGRDFGAALETAGGIVRALPLLDEVFWVLGGDVFAPDFAFSQAAVDRFTASDKLAHLWLVPNPEHHPRGDFGLEFPPAPDNGTPSDPTVGLALNLPDTDARPRLTYSTIGLYRRAFFTAPFCDIPFGNPQGIAAPLGPMMRAAMDQQRVSASLYAGRWTDVGTPHRLEQLNAAS